MFVNKLMFSFTDSMFLNHIVDVVPSTPQWVPNRRTRVRMLRQINAIQKPTAGRDSVKGVMEYLEFVCILSNPFTT